MEDRVIEVEMDKETEVGMIQTMVEEIQAKEM
jgi:hypothetical protein